KCRRDRRAIPDIADSLPHARARYRSGSPGNLPSHNPRPLDSGTVTCHMLRVKRTRFVAEERQRMAEEMRIAVGQFNELTDEILQFTKQLGVGGVQMNLLGHSPLPG